MHFFPIKINIEIIGSSHEGEIMAKLFFQYKTDPYLFDTRRLKLFQLKPEELVEIDNPKMLRNVRLDATEINRKRAFKLANRTEVNK